ncbi:MAG: substrate-binding periplasmic protein [Alishewanella aestuarii]
MLKKVLLNLVLVITAFKTFATTANEQSEPQNLTKQSVRWCFDNLPPRQYYTNGQEPVGSMVGFMKELAHRLNTELHYSIPTPTTRCLQELERGKVDIVTGLMLTTDRKQRFHMFPFDSARPNSWFVNKLYPITAGQQLRLTLIQSQIQANETAEQLIAAGYTVNLVADFDTALTHLFFNKTDVVVGPEHITQKHIAQNGRYQNVLILAPQEYQQHTDAYIAISKQGELAKRSDEIELIIKELRASGRFQFYEQ